MTYRADGKIDYEIFTATGERHFVTLVRDANSVIALDEQGRFIARVGDLDGAPGFLPHPVN